VALLGWLALALAQPAGQAEAADDGSEPAPFKKGIDLATPKDCAILGFSPDGRILATALHGWGWTGLEGPIRLWDVRTGKLQATVADGWKKIETVRFSPDSSLIAAHEESGELRVWEIRTGKSRGAFTPPTRFRNSVGFWFTPDSAAVIYQYRGEPLTDSVYKVWDIGTGRELGSIDAVSWMFTFAPGGKRLATGIPADTPDRRNIIMLWTWDGGNKGLPTLVKKHAVGAGDVAFSPDLTAFATAAYAADDDTAEVRIRDMETGRERASLTFVDKETRIQELLFSPDGGMLLASGGGGTQLAWTTRTTVWDITAKPPKQVGAFPTRPDFSPDGRLLAVPTDERILLQDARTGRQIGGLARPGEVTPSLVGYNNHKTYPDVRFAPDGRLLVVTGSYGEDRAGPLQQKARVWQVDPVRELCTLDEALEALFAPDGRTLLIRYTDGAVKLWEIPPLATQARR
jgi:WD40 repeat protein